MQTALHLCSPVGEAGPLEKNMSEICPQAFVPVGSIDRDKK